MTSESATLLALVFLWIFACPHRFAGVWDAWGGSEARLLRNVEKDGKETMRTVIDCVVKLRQLRADLLVRNNSVAQPAGVTENDDDVQDDDDADDDVVDDDDDSDDDSEDDAYRGAGNANDIERKFTTYKVHACHVKLLQLCMCRNAAACTCVSDTRVPDTIFYRRDDKYDAETINGCASMFAYRFIPHRAYIVHIRQYACET